MNKFAMDASGVTGSHTGEQCIEARAQPRSRNFHTSEEIDAILAGLYEDPMSPTEMKGPSKCTLPASSESNLTPDTVSAEASVNPAEERSSFPPPQSAAYATFTPAGLVEAIEDIAREVKVSSGTYLLHRESFCMINLELNRRQITFAPRFRGNPRPSHKAPMPAEQLLGLDRQIIDLHWLHSRGIKRRIATDIYEDLLLEKEFSFDLAQEFAAEVWTGDHKASLLSLPAHLQWQLDTIQPSSFADRSRRLRNGERSGGRMKAKGLPQIRAELENSIINLPQHSGIIDEWATLWLCHQMMGREAPAALASLYSLATGTKPMASSSISRKLKRVLARLG